MRAGPIEHTDRAYGPLPGLVEDSLPDGWGRLLMDRMFRQRGIEPASVSPLDRLSYLGTRAMGALTFHPPADETDRDDRLLDLHELGENAQAVLEGETTTILPQLMRAGGSPAGARPKVLVGIQEGQIVSGEDDLPHSADPTRGLSGHGLKVEAGAGRDGSKALVVQGGTDQQREKSHYQDRGGFLFLPQIELEANTTYEVEAWVRIVGEHTAARITADQYEWTPHDPARTARLETNIVTTPDTWQKLHLRFTTPAWDANVDPPLHGRRPGQGLLRRLPL